MNFELLSPTVASGSGPPLVTVKLAAILAAPCARLQVSGPFLKKALYSSIRF